MFESIMIAIIVVGGSLLGFRWWLDRLHPESTPQASLDAEWERRFEELKERVDSQELGKRLGSRRSEIDE